LANVSFSGKATSPFFFDALPFYHNRFPPQKKKPGFFKVDSRDFLKNDEKINAVLK
jgi:hypothetical protein